jgi:hypothetical protein
VLTAPLSDIARDASAISESEHRKQTPPFTSLDLLHSTSIAQHPVYGLAGSVAFRALLSDRQCLNPVFTLGARPEDADAPKHSCLLLTGPTPAALAILFGSTNPTQAAACALRQCDDVSRYPLSSPLDVRDSQFSFALVCTPLLTDCYFRSHPKPSSVHH